MKRTGEGMVAIIPIIDGRSLSGLVERFEKDSGYRDPAGGYAGIVPAFFNFGPLDAYYRGENPACTETGKIAVLACECGELGCWPLECRVSIDGDTVTWSDFEQPHRETRDYTAFGPFRFDRHMYEEALAGLPRS